MSFRKFIDLIGTYFNYPKTIGEGFENIDQLPHVFKGIDDYFGKVAKFAGTRGVNVLRVAANVADGQTVVINGKVFEVDIINTDTTKVTDDEAWKNTTNPLTVTIENHGLVVGNIIRVENEMMKVDMVSGNIFRVQRGYCGTTVVAHNDGQNIYKTNAQPAAGIIPIGLVTTLTPKAFVDAFVPEVNRIKDAIGVQAIKISDNEVLFVTTTAHATEIAITETLAGANNELSDVHTYGGASEGIKRFAHAIRVPTATEVALGNIHVALDFKPAIVLVKVKVTATGTSKAWDGVTTVGDQTSAPYLVTIDNSGNSDWAATDTLEIFAVE